MSQQHAQGFHSIPKVSLQLGSTRLSPVERSNPHSKNRPKTGFTLSAKDENSAENELIFSAESRNKNENENESDSSFEHSRHFALSASVSDFVELC